MTEQEAFDIVWKGLEAQEWLPSANAARTTCMFRGADGMKCAVGQLIPDAEFDLSMETQSIERLIRIVPALDGIFPDFLHMIMSAHDHILDFPDRFMSDALREVAESRGLTVPD